MTGGTSGRDRNEPETAVSGISGLEKAFLIRGLLFVSGAAHPLLADLPATEANSLMRLSLSLFLGERCLRDLDSTSMASSLEVRAPFTDHLLLSSLMMAIPATLRTAGPPDKRFERRVFSHRLPKIVTARRKQGFILPFSVWLASGLAPDPVRELWRSFTGGARGVPWSRIWALVVLLHWCRAHRMVAAN